MKDQTCETGGSEPSSEYLFTQHCYLRNNKIFKKVELFDDARAPAGQKALWVSVCEIIIAIVAQEYQVPMVPSDSIVVKIVPNRREQLRLLAGEENYVEAVVK